MSYQQFQPPRRVPAHLPVPHWLTDPAQIAANQQGFLTAEQISWLASRKYVTMGSRGCGLVIIPGTFFLLVGGTLIYAALHGYLPTPTNPGTFLPYLIGVGLLALMGFGIGLFRQSQAAQNRFKDDVAMGKIVLSIEKRQGEVIWDQKRKGYFIHQPGQISFPEQNRRISARNPLTPGPYHFYYAREEGLMVSAQAIHTHTQMLPLPGTLAATGMPGNEQTRTIIQYALCDSNEFSLLDLDTNRQGFLSNEQLLKHRAPIRQLTKRQQPILVQSIDGEIEFTEVTHDESPSDCYYCIGKDRFKVPNVSSRDALISGIRYRLYYLAGPQIMLSVEPLDIPQR